MNDIETALFHRYREYRKFFDEKSGNWTFSEEDRFKAQSLLKGIVIPPLGSILDVGCGTGRLFPILKDLTPNATIIGCDLSWRMLSDNHKISENRQVYVLQCYGEMLPLRNNSIDVVLNYCVFPHLKHKETAIKEFYRVLKKNGLYYIIHPDGRKAINERHRYIGEPVSHDLLPPSEEINNLLKVHSFHVDQIIDQPDLFYISAIKRG